MIAVGNVSLGWRIKACVLEYYSERPFMGGLIGLMVMLSLLCVSFNNKTIY